MDDWARTLLRRIADNEVECVWDDDGGEELFALITEDPAAVGDEILVLLARVTASDGRSAEEMFRSLSLQFDVCPGWPQVVATIMRQRFADTEWLGSSLCYVDVAALASGPVLAELWSKSLGADARWAWDLAVDLVSISLPGPKESVPDPKAAMSGWDQIATLLSLASTDSSAVEMLAGIMRERLGQTAWARTGPPPALPEFRDARGRALGIPSNLVGTVRYADLFHVSELRTQQAVAHADALEAVIRRRQAAGGDLERWLPAVAEALPGCGHWPCCHPGLFEWELYRRGHRPYHWPTLPVGFLPG